MPHHCPQITQWQTSASQSHSRFQLVVLLYLANLAFYSLKPKLFLQITYLLSILREGHFHTLLLSSLKIGDNGFHTKK